MATTTSSASGEVGRPTRTTVARTSRGRTGPRLRPPHSGIGSTCRSGFASPSDGAFAVSATYVGEAYAPDAGRSPGPNALVGPGVATTGFISVVGPTTPGHALPTVGPGTTGPYEDVRCRVTTTTVAVPFMRTLRPSSTTGDPALVTATTVTV